MIASRPCADVWRRSLHVPTGPLPRPSPPNTAKLGSRPVPRRSPNPQRAVLEVPPALADLLPRAGLARGSVVSVDGASSALLSLLASVTGSGKHAAIIGLPKLGLLAATEWERTSPAAP
ncbi:hypothetical protein [Rhodococcus erythropolis]|uniref:hypothetical protein n=1 Tax=Rhodococcus erythropolis TaxID=1833 RepID=UPI00366C7D18